MSKVYYIGELPPPYGGVTVKNKLLYKEFQKYHDIEMIDLMSCKRKLSNIPIIFIKIVIAFVSKSTIVYGMGSMKRLGILLTIQNIFSNSIKNTILIAMGGKFSQKVVKNHTLRKLCPKTKNIWVETEGMKEELICEEFNNVRVFPNPKSENGCCNPRKIDEVDSLKLVFFSQISKEKGVDDIIKLVELLEQNNVKYILDFYGHPTLEIKERFENFVQIYSNVNYKGVFDATKSSVYKKLNEYDILLLPTHWYAEGVPGILVEAKMAGIAVIVSNQNYNSEIIRQKDKEGFVINKNYPQEMYRIIQDLADDREKLYMVKQSSYKSRKRYAIETYREMLINL